MTKLGGKQKMCNDKDKLSDVSVPFVQLSSPRPLCDLSFTSQSPEFCCLDEWLIASSGEEKGAVLTEAHWKELEVLEKKKEEENETIKREALRP